jgi:AcrR family transcriptional regulator
MPHTATHPRKTPRQARSRATVSVILEAAALLLVEDGFDQVTTNQIAERAGVSIGSLYQYFPNREALIVAVAQRTEAQLSEVIRQTVVEAIVEAPPSDLRSLLSSGLHATVSAHAGVLPLSRILLAVTPRRVDALSKWPPVLHDLFSKYSTELRSNFDIGVGSILIPSLVDSAIDTAILSHPATLANGELERELNTMLSYYLIGDR